MRTISLLIGELNNSYTQYKNKVGLTIDGKYLKQRNEVSLVWPFKDFVLEGGQTKEEQKQHLVEILDKNQLYVNLSSLNDKDLEISEEEKNITKNFYGI